MEQYTPDRILCTWDERLEYKANAREELLGTYKGTRNSEKNKEVHSQNELIKKLLNVLGVVSIFPERYEADDVIAILHNHFNADEKIIITADRDLCQLIDAGTVVVDSIRKKTYTHVNFENELGVSKENFIRMKAIKGDKSDNIPGVGGFGDVKTRKVLNGEIFLTEEQELRVNKNIQLLDLSLTLHVQTERAYVIKQLDTIPVKNYKLFREICTFCNFQQIIKNIENWHTAFFIKDRLQCILNF